MTKLLDHLYNSQARAMFKRDNLVPRRTYGLVIPVIAIVAEYFWLEKVKREASEKFLEKLSRLKLVK